jgi:hypothetical protein
VWSVSSVGRADDARWSGPAGAATGHPGTGHDRRDTQLLRAAAPDDRAVAAFDEGVAPQLEPHDLFLLHLELFLRENAGVGQFLQLLDRLDLLVERWRLGRGRGEWSRR